MCDGEEPAIFESAWRTARVEHRCCECGCAIRKGERYRYVKGLWSGRWDSFSIHEACESLRTILERFDDCPIPFGQVLSAASYRDVMRDVAASDNGTMEDARLVGFALGVLWRVDERRYDWHEERLRGWRSKRTGAAVVRQVDSTASIGGGIV
jgi:hypothetical protein